MRKKLPGFLLIIFLLNYSCNQKAGQGNFISLKSKTVSGVIQTQDSIKPPVVVLLNTRPEPETILIPVKAGVTRVIKTKDGNREITLIPPIQIAAQLPIADYTRFTTDEGLPLTGVSRGFKDSRGLLWFATQGAGVCSYDGKSFTTYNTSHGLTANTVWHIAEDANGSLWFATDDGVSCYNGKSFANYYVKNGLGNNTVFNVFKDKSGAIWFGTNGGGATRFDGKNFATITTSQGLAANIVRTGLALDKRIIAFGTNGGGVSFYNPVKKDSTAFINYSTSSGLAYLEVSCVIEDKTGNLWLGTEGGGLSILKNYKSTFSSPVFSNYNTAHGLAGNTVWSMAQDKDSLIWIGSKGGVSYCNPAKTENGSFQFLNFSAALGLQDGNVSTIIEDNSGSLWLGTDGSGVIRYNGKSTASFSLKQGLPNAIIWGITQDNNGNLWFATNGGGVSMYDGKTFTTYTTQQGLADNIVWGVTQDHTGKIWFATMNGGVSCYQDNAFTNYTTEQGLAGNNVRCISEDSKGNLWFGTYRSGVSCFNPVLKSFTNYTTEQGLAGNTVRSIVEDNKGNIWFTSNGSGVSCFDPSTSLRTGSKSFTNYTTEQGLAGNIVFNITKDSVGMLWFGTEGGGISRYDGKTFLNFSTKEGLADNVVYDTQQDSSGRIWCGTNQGFTVLSFETPDKKIQGAGNINLSNDELKKCKLVCESYNSKTGYPIKDLNTNAMCITKLKLPYGDETNIVWGGCGNDKVIRFDPAYVNRSLKPPDVVLQKIKIREADIPWYSLQKNNSADSTIISQQEVMTFGENLPAHQRDTLLKKYEDVTFDSISSFYPVPQNLVLPYNFNHITFEYNATETRRHSMVNYQYKLIGEDDDWNPVTKKSEVTFNNLQEGGYTFLLKAQSPDGIWSEPVAYQFTVLPPWFRTWWAYMLCVFASAAFLISVFRWRTFQLRKEKEYLEVTVSERTDQLRLSLDEKEILIREIHHRVKNNLEVISSLLELQTKEIGDDKAKAAIIEAQNRVQSIALVHHKLYRNDNVGSVEFSNFADDLFKQVCDVFKKPGVEVVHKIIAEETQIPIDAAVPLGLILNELLTNTFKYAVTGDKINSITIQLNNEIDSDGLIKMIYHDNGPGLPADYKIEKSTSLGMKVIQLLTKQLGGKLNFYNDNGSVFEIPFVIST